MRDAFLAGMSLVASAGGPEEALAKSQNVPTVPVTENVIPKTKDFSATLTSDLQSSRIGNGWVTTVSHALSKEEEKVYDPEKLVQDDRALQGKKTENWSLEDWAQLDPLLPDHYKALESAFTDPLVDYSTLTDAPDGFIKLCQRVEQMCKFFNERHSGGSLKELTPTNFHLFDYLNTTINEEVIAAQDIDTFNQPEFWNVPKLGEKGDCEDYALLKFYNLLFRDADSKDMHILVVSDKKGEGHAVILKDVRKDGAEGIIGFDNWDNIIRTLQQMKALGYTPNTISRLEYQADGTPVLRFYVYKERQRDFSTSYIMSSFAH